jgi:cytochrome c
LTRRRTVLVVFVTCVCWSGGCRSRSGWTTVDATGLWAGRKLYLANCTQCHGTTGKGDGVVAATLNPRPRDHTDAQYMRGLTDEQIADTIRHGGTIKGKEGMPSFPCLTATEVVQILAFVRTLPTGGHESIVVRVKPEGPDAACGMSVSPG